MIIIWWFQIFILAIINNIWMSCTKNRTMNKSKIFAPLNWNINYYIWIIFFDILKHIHLVSVSKTINSTTLENITASNEWIIFNFFSFTCKITFCIISLILLRHIRIITFYIIQRIMILILKKINRSMRDFCLIKNKIKFH